MLILMQETENENRKKVFSRSEEEKKQLFGSQIILPMIYKTKIWLHAKSLCLALIKMIPLPI